MNYFDHQTAAERYAKNRPYFHQQVIDKIRDFLKLSEPLPRALDVACGTGQSAVALKEIADEIVGIDSSREMLAQAPHDPRLRYLQAPAERLPFADESFDLVTVALAFHWFDRVRFLSEAQRVLYPSGWLIIYDNGFLGKMRENPGFERWYHDDYLARYSSPPRDRRPLTGDEAQTNGFRFVAQEEYTNEVLFSVEELTNYLMTQSSVIAAVENGTEDLDDVKKWLTDNSARFFVTSQGTFEFGGTIIYLQKAR